MTDDDLRLDVVAEPSWDPKVSSEAIGVSAEAGAITLATAWSAPGVTDIDDRIAVEYPGTTALGLMA